MSGSSVSLCSERQAAGTCKRSDGEAPGRSVIALWRGAVDEIDRIVAKAPCRKRDLPIGGSPELKKSQTVSETPCEPEEK